MPNNILWDDSCQGDWTFDDLERIWKRIDDIGKNQLGLDYYEPRIEVISSQQMLDNYSSHALPIMYPHWSFGKTYIANEKRYKEGLMGLAYEVVINSNPSIAYLMENNSITMQALVLAHASCVDKETEYLTPDGWKKISEYDKEPILTYDIETGEAKFEFPSRYIETDTNCYYTITAQGISQRITADHTMIYKEPHSGKIKKELATQFVARHNDKTRGHCGKFITHFKYSGKGLDLSEEEIRLSVAIKADGSLNKKINSGHFNCVDYQRVKFHLKKPRKIDRLISILERLNIEYTKTPSYDDRYFICFNVPIHKYGKHYDTSWYAATTAQLKTIGEEILHWDGCLSSNSFSSIYKKDADYVQFVWSALGYGTSMCEDTSKENVCYSVIRGSYSERSISRSRGGKRNEIIKETNIKEKAYCFTVHTGAWVARRNNCIFITGNCGHSHFFKNNYLYKNWSDADSILDYLKFARTYIQKCEREHGTKEVELLLDACHSLQYNGVDKYKRPAPKKNKDSDKKNARWAHEEENFNDIWRTLPRHKTNTQIKEEYNIQFPEENLLYFIEKYSPKLEPWQKEIVRIIRKISQYFYPQMQDKVMNEGTACFFHHLIMTLMYEQGNITSGAYLEFIHSHSSVVYQPNYYEPWYRGVNIYALGFAMMQDIKRMCVSPTDEDWKHCPNVCGKPWLETIKNIICNYRDESFILQFLSPKVIRDFGLFSLYTEEGENRYLVTGVHREEDVTNIRKVLSAQYDISKALPRIEVSYVDFSGDRELHLKHYAVNSQTLDHADAKKTIKYLEYLWGHPVWLEYIEEGNDL